VRSCEVLSQQREECRSHIEGQPARRHGGAGDSSLSTPDTIIEIDGYSHWITELLIQPYSDYLTKIGCFGLLHSCAKPTKAQEDYLVGIIRNELGNLTSARALVVGYGGFACRQYTINADGDDDCQRDGQRRSAEAPLVPSVSAGGETFGVPWVWCTGKNSEDINPVRRGDSGGPLFVRAEDGRWLFVGYLAMGGTWGCSSSLIYNLNFWRGVLDSDEYAAMPRGRSQEWYAKQTERAVYEVFAAFSTPSEKATLRLREIYRVFEDENGEVVALDNGSRDRGGLHKMLYSQKKTLFKRWPVRTYSVARQSLRIENVVLRPGREVPDAFYQASGVVDWKYYNPVTNAKKEGRSEFSFLFATAALEQDQMHGQIANPILYEEDLGSAEDAFEMLRDASLMGGDYWNGKGFSLKSCQFVCQMQKECVAFSFVERLQWCWLKSSVPRSVGKKGITSGVRMN
jgi:hypothetical protein